MIYAIISDIHGNYFAFKAVIDDALDEGDPELFLVRKKTVK